MTSNVLVSQIKELIIRELNLEGKVPADLDENAALFGEGLGLDSLDALQLAMAIEERFQVKLPEGDEVRPIFRSVTSLAEFVARAKGRRAVRVFVTGLGVVSPLARGADATMDLLMAGRSAFRAVSLFDTSHQRSSVAAEAHGFPVRAGDDVTMESRTDAMAIAAAREALAQAGLGSPATETIDLVIGGTTGGMLETEELLASMWRHPMRREPLRAMLSHPLSATSDRLQEALGPLRRARTLCSACSGGANAIALGSEWIRAGESERVLVGGADGLCRLTFTGFNALAAITTDVCRPFDARRSGLRLGEGAAFLVLESASSVRARQAVPLAELAGAAVGCEAHHITHPEQSGATAAALIGRALAAAGLAPGDVDYVNAHGTGTPLNDAMEAAALHRALGTDALRVPVSSVKGQIGHTLGAAGAIEAAVTVLAIARGVIPPTGGLELPDPACNLVHVIGKGRTATVRTALSNSFGFGGANTVLVFTRPHASPPRARLPRPVVVVTGGATLGAHGVRSPEASLAYAEASLAPPDPGMLAAALRTLDGGRARRMDRAARLLTLTMEAALRPAQAEATPEAGGDALSLIDAFRPEAEETSIGAVAGSAYGTVDASAEFMRQTYEKGPRFASPAAFPNLVPSSPVSHAAIYLGLRGPVLATADLGVSGEAAFATACELLCAGKADVMVAASVEEQSDIAERVLGPVCAASTGWGGARSEGAAALVLDTEAGARRRGNTPLARVAHLVEGRGGWEDRIAALPPPAGKCTRVFMARADAEVERALQASAWRDAPLLRMAPGAGNHEGLGGFALVAAAGAVGAGRADQVLVVGVAPDRYFFAVLERA